MHPVTTYHTRTCRVCGDDTTKAVLCPLCTASARMDVADLEPFYTYVTKMDPWDGPQALLARRALDYRIAYKEGRLPPHVAEVMELPTNNYPCGVCGMRHHKRESALRCCASMVEASEEARNMLRVERQWTLA